MVENCVQQWKKMDLTEETDERICRICQERGDADDLRSPCRCRGSVRWVHGECMATWVGPILEQRRGPPVCELCQTRMNVTFRFPHDGIRSFLFGPVAPPAVGRTWLSLAFVLATCFLFVTRGSFAVKVVSWFAQAILVQLLSPPPAQGRGEGRRSREAGREACRGPHFTPGPRIRCHVLLPGSHRV